MSLLLHRNDRIDRIIEFLSDIDHELRAHIIRVYYSIVNTHIIRQQRLRKICLNQCVRTRADCWVLERPIQYQQHNFDKIYQDFEEFMDVSRYSIKINADRDEILEIKNLQVSETTLAQFIFFVKMLIRFLTTKITILIHPIEIKQLFLQTPIRSFRVLFMLYEARDIFIRSKSFNVSTYRAYITEYMRKKGHDIVTERITDDLYQFFEN